MGRRWGAFGTREWTWYMERMSKKRLTKRTYVSEVERAKGRGRPKGKWKDGVKATLGYLGLNIQEGEKPALHRNNWSYVVYGGRGNVKLWAEPEHMKWSCNLSFKTLSEACFHFNVLPESTEKYLNPCNTSFSCPPNNISYSNSPISKTTLIL